MTEPYDNGGWLPGGLSLAVNATLEPEEVQAPDTAPEYTCGRCERNQHRRCTELGLPLLRRLAVSLHRWLERRAERRDERERARQERGYVVAGVYLGNRTPGTRVAVFPELGLPEGFDPPSAALFPRRGTYLDPQQIPRTLKKPAREPGQPPRLDLTAVPPPVPSPPDDYEGSP